MAESDTPKRDVAGQWPGRLSVSTRAVNFRIFRLLPFEYYALASWAMLVLAIEKVMLTKIENFCGKIALVHSI